MKAGVVQFKTFNIDAHKNFNAFLMNPKISVTFVVTELSFTEKLEQIFDKECFLILSKLINGK